jgi:hypothetical protein
MYLLDHSISRWIPGSRRRERCKVVEGRVEAVVGIEGGEAGC